MRSKLSWAAMEKGTPPFEEPVYNRDMCGCYIGYGWYVYRHYGSGMMTIEEWCAYTSSSGTSASSSGVPTSSSGAPASSSGAPTSSSGVPITSSGAPTSSSGTPTSSSGAPISSSGTPTSSSGTGAMQTQNYQYDKNTRHYAVRGTCLLDTLLSDTVSLPDPCIKLKANQAIYNAKRRYEDQVKMMTTQFRQAYYEKCLSLVENFTAKVPIKDYHYTLYFYDQAGSLVATVPPEGVRVIDLAAKVDGITNGERIKRDRGLKIKTLYNTHYLKSTYEYNKP